MTGGPGPRVGDSGMEASVGSWLTMDILILEMVLVVLQLVEEREKFHGLTVD